MPTKDRRSRPIFQVLASHRERNSEVDRTRVRTVTTACQRHRHVHTLAIAGFDHGRLGRGQSEARHDPALNSTATVTALLSGKLLKVRAQAPYTSRAKWIGAESPFASVGRMCARLRARSM